MYCSKTICQNSDNKNKNICCHNCDIKCSTACEKSIKNCRHFILKKKDLYDKSNDLKALIKNKLELKHIHSITYNNTDNNEMTIECIGGSSITITPVIIDGEARLSIELKHIEEKVGVL